MQGVTGLSHYYPDYLAVILIGVLAGTASRIILLRIDYRQYPGYPHGYLTHTALGLIASALGAVAVPALLKPDFVAVTFLSLAAQQFREIRNVERQTLESLEKTELVKRGLDYIEGIARTFEARNYLVMGTSLITAFAAQFGGIPAAVFAAFLMLYASYYFMSGELIGDICDVVPARLSFEEGILKVDEIGLVNIGLKSMRDKILRDGLAVRIKPRDSNARATIHDIGQRTAIAFTAAVFLGTKKDVDLPEFTPLARKNPDTGDVGLYIVPVHKDIEKLIAAIKLTPVLESARSKPLNANQASSQLRRR
ncbi:YIEGIA family protein [Pelotomaculum isophthalicicum JI]|uniref:YIEGIA family protein n=1 Tax=Pelotomaculum isophthalicicum JI TaxID=947010 RepID=A0A9X4H2K1_9FIRM|nr:YIEGIA family protein [Pelotomaculum isophthalicicum]MDF9407368.1 YIEGIA family protein [Pelotomaculum isophthalicicum JI]